MGQDFPRLRTVELRVANFIERPLAVTAQPALREPRLQVLVQFIVVVEAVRRLPPEVHCRIVSRVGHLLELSRLWSPILLARCGRHLTSRPGHDREDHAHGPDLIFIFWCEPPNFMIQVEMIDRLIVIELRLRYSQGVDLK